MATYKVPQDVEADDKLLGPFTFRQFVYLMVILGLVLAMVGLFQIFPLLAIIPVPFIIFFGILALPIKKDQPMETYLAALVSFYTKPKKRYWLAGQSDSTILITAPKRTEPVRARNITEDEASHRLSFLAELVDSEGHAIKNANTTMKDDFYAEAMNTTDMFERSNNFGPSRILAEEEAERRAAVVDQMREAIQASEASKQASTNANPIYTGRVIQPRQGFTGNTGSDSTQPTPGLESPTIVQPNTSPRNGSDEVFISLH